MIFTNELHLNGDVICITGRVTDGQPARNGRELHLRAVQCPADIADQIGGWATDGVGQGYGSGYPIEVLME